MCFRLENVLETSQQAMKVLVTKFKGQLALVYFGYITIFLSSSNDHIYNARQLLTLFHDAGLTLNLTKCGVSTDYAAISVISFALDALSSDIRD